MAERKSTKSTKSSSSSKRAGSSKKRSSAAGKTVSRRRKKTGIDKNKAGLFCGIVFLAGCICLAVKILSTPVPPAVPQQKTPPAVEKTQSQTQTKPVVPKTQTPAPSKQTASPSSQNSVASKQATAPSKQTAPAKKAVPAVPKTSVKTQTQTKPAEVKVPEIANNRGELLASAKGDAEQRSPFTIPPAKNGATLVIIIDDAGLNVKNTKKYTDLPFPITIAVLPKLANSKACAYAVRNAGKELILHQPMQSLNHNINPGPGKITVDMSFSEISQIVNENLAEIGPGVKGLNNHEGSEVTEDVLRIGAVIDVCQENNIYFLDSRTTVNTKAPQAALERDVKIFEKAGPYIDNVVTREAMLKELYKALDFANKNGKAIIIGHVDKSANILPELLKEMYPYLKKAGYKFATPSTL